MNIQDIRRELKGLGDPEKAAHAQGFFKTGPGQYGEGDCFLGIRVPVIRKFAKQCRDLTLPQILNLLKSRYHEERLLALVVLVGQYEQGDEQLRGKIVALYLENTDRINNWDLVDASAHRIVGPWLEDRPRDLLYELAASSWLWDRRIAMMSTFHYIRSNDYHDALEIAAILLHDEHDLIHKIVGWMLREIGNRDREREERFLRDHLGAMPRTMLRYAIEKFPEELRLQYLQGRI